MFYSPGPALAGISMHSNNPAIVGQGVFATASFATFKMRKDVELWEICFTMLQKVPKAYNKVDTILMLGSAGICSFPVAVYSLSEAVSFQSVTDLNLRNDIAIFILIPDGIWSK